MRETSRNNSDKIALDLICDDRMKEREVVLIRLAQLEDFLIANNRLKQRTKERGKR